MDSKLSALDIIKICLANRRNFVLQGGAGSGKTETLKDVLSHVSARMPAKNVACITLTNKAAEEIKKRTGERYHVSTIHSFLHTLIGRFQKDIQGSLAELYVIKQLTSPSGKLEDIAHKDYKNAYGQYAITQYRFAGTKVEKVVDKKTYDKNPHHYVTRLTEMVETLNAEIIAHVANADCRLIRYNEGPFDNIKSLTYGHDGLLRLSAVLLRKHDKLRRVLRDKFDFIFIDEYQDTSPDIVAVILDVVAVNCKATVGFFGDSMQGIYDGGIGDLERYIAEGRLKKIDKEDNFRCSEQVVKFLNRLRLDTLKQEVALKVSKNDMEKLTDRQGSVSCFLSICPEGARDNKELYIKKLNALIARAKRHENSKVLLLTNKSIANEVGFPTLFSVFNDRYGKDAAEQMKRVVSILQLDELANLCSLFVAREFNEVIARTRRSGFVLGSQVDKLQLHSKLNALSKSKDGAIATVMSAYRDRIVMQSEACVRYFENKEKFLSDLHSDVDFAAFIAAMKAGLNTAKRMRDGGLEIDDFQFDDLERLLKRRDFYNKLFSADIPFTEVLNYACYLNDEKPYVTMHKTKGTGIENVVVVLDEYYWRDHNFKNILSKDVRVDQVMDRKLVYVACSRAIKNLTCVKIIDVEEHDAFLSAGFDNFEVIDFHAL